MKESAALATHRDLLARVAALLLALAALAERASACAEPVCRLVVRLLCPAEAVAQKFAARAGRAAIAPRSAPPPSRGPGRGPGGGSCGDGGCAADETSGEAVRLARRFRALAALFKAWARQTALGLALDSIGRARGRRAAARVGRLLPDLQPRCPDTS